MQDMHEHCDNAQALEVLKGMADWADHWSATIPEPAHARHSQTEYGSYTYL